MGNSLTQTSTGGSGPSAPTLALPNVSTPAVPTTPAPAPAGVPASAPAGAPSGASPLAFAKSQHDLISSQYNSINTTLASVDRLKTRLANLSKLGDMVTTEDVIKEASGAIAHGIPAGQIAGLLAEMPESGPQIAGWLQEKTVVLQQTEAGLLQAQEQMREHLGHAGMQMLMAHVMSPGTPAAAGGGGNAPTNALTPAAAPSALAPAAAPSALAPSTLGGPHAS